MSTAPLAATSEPRAIGAADRWRLVLGREPQGGSAPARRAGRALDELYGRGHGEGSQDPTGGRGRPEPAPREWSEELEALFGATVREEVLGRAAERGRSDVLDHLDPDTVTPSVDLLEQVLSLAGALPEARLARLRPLVKRITDRLTAELARRLRPALTGLSVPRPTRRRGGRLDLGRTVRANLHTVRPGPDGPVLLPERPVFATRARRSADWHVHIVVDVSGSMERSTIHAALVAAILHGLPALSVSLTAFSTEVIDLTDRVHDPLALLLEVAVGGGTDIGAALAHTRSAVRVPGRTIVALITDFEEGGSLGRTLAEVRALASSGVHLLGLAALDHGGAPVYNRAIASSFADAGMPVAALGPEELAAWIGEKVRG
ncbi:VWA domain-containing protein [Nocardiopsis protaetiae]|uniref:VWA domain-containing protein n=1 Tax=Nocardiopsis protaetiae TaxID=3382270 RepID=UPI00387B30D2